VRGIWKHKARERARITRDNRMCSFCLLHDEAEVSRTKVNKSKPACGTPECRGQHALWLHELLKDMVGQEGKVNMVQGGNGWRTPEEAWMEDAEEEVMFVNVMWAETMDWEKEATEDVEETEKEVLSASAMLVKTTDLERELEEEIARTRVAVDECYRRRAKRAGVDIGGTEGRLLSEEELDDLSEQLGEGARAKRRREIERICRLRSRRSRDPS
jgi:hypothetical protein